MLEVELKARADTEKIKETLLRKGAHFIASEREEDLYFNHPARDYRVTDEALRIRSSGDKCFLTYKGPKQPGPAKIREELELEIPSAERGRQLLEKLGFHPVTMVRKKRDIYRLGDITVCLDQVENLGQFVELELVGLEREEAEKKLLELAAAIGLKDFIRASYLELMDRTAGSARTSHAGAPGTGRSGAENALAVTGHIRKRRLRRRLARPRRTPR
jgi:adenylate cyclase class 2